MNWGGSVCGGFSFKGRRQRMGKILVEMDVHNGLLEGLDIEWRGKTYGQKLDYMGLPF
jgi:hypothetical protein